MRFYPSLLIGVVLLALLQPETAAVGSRQLPLLSKGLRLYGNSRGAGDIEIGPDPTFQCPPNTSIAPHPGNCELYYTCYPGYPVTLWQCYSDYLFDLTYSGCNFPIEVDCGVRKRPIASEQTTDTTPKTTTTPLCDTIPANQPTFNCPTSDGFFAIPNSCTGDYYVCVSGSPYVSTCPNGNIFDPATGLCTPPENASCTKPVFTCPTSDGFYAIPGACSNSYYACVGNVPYLQNCPGNSIFDPVTKNCVPPANASCAVSTSPTTPMSTVTTTAMPTTTPITSTSTTIPPSTTTTATPTTTTPTTTPTTTRTTTSTSYTTTTPTTTTPTTTPTTTTPTTTTTTPTTTTRTTTTTTPTTTTPTTTTTTPTTTTPTTTTTTPTTTTRTTTTTTSTTTTPTTTTPTTTTTKTTTTPTTTTPTTTTTIPTTTTPAATTTTSTTTTPTTTPTTTTPTTTTPTTTTTTPTTTTPTTTTSTTTTTTSTTATPTTTTPTRPTTVEPFTCSQSDGYFPVPGVACSTQYYMCSNYYEYLMDCPVPTVYNPTIQTCDWTYNVAGCQRVRVAAKFWNRDK